MLVKKLLNSSLPNLKYSVLTDWSVPIDKNGIKKIIELLKRFTSPLSSGDINRGCVYTSISKNDTAFEKKLMMV